MKYLKKVCAVCLALCCVTLTACSGDEPNNVVSEDRASVQEINRTERAGYDPNDTWAIYWYLCGSDLESNYGAATEDLDEMMQVELPENVQIIIETGGASEWQNSEISADQTERYRYSSDGFELVDEQPLANMGDPDTLTDFLSFCTENYPADHTAVIFWNHGGGSVTGAAFDENYEFDSLTLAEMYTAFDSVYELSQESPPFELVGFDACLMATIDTAYTFADVAQYMVASEELEPGNGWYYTGWVEALAENPGMDEVDMESEADEEPTDDDDDADGESVMTDEEYTAGMAEFTPVFESMTEQIGGMIANFDDSDAWYTQFAEAYKIIGDFATELAEMTAHVPESYTESHVNITVAVAAYADMMDAVGSAADAYKSGDEATGDELMATAQGLYEGATELWSAAFEE